MQLLSSLAILLSVSAPLATAWSVSVYTEENCQSMTGSYGDTKGWGCTKLDFMNPIQSIQADMDPGFVFQGFYNDDCSSNFSGQGSGCYSLPSGFQPGGFRSFNVVPV